MVEIPEPSDTRTFIDGCEVVGIVSSRDTEVIVRLADGRTSCIPMSHPLFDALGLIPADPPLSQSVDAERDRRMTTVTFNGVVYQCDPDSQQKITAMGTDARFALIAGRGVAGDFRWANPNVDFGWIALDNSVTLMDAQHMSDFSEFAKQWVMSHIFAARTLKDMNPTPSDFTSDKYWPVL